MTVVDPPAYRATVVWRPPLGTTLAEAAQTLEADGFVVVSLKEVAE